MCWRAVRVLCHNMSEMFLRDQQDYTPSKIQLYIIGIYLGQEECISKLFKATMN